MSEAVTAEVVTLLMENTSASSDTVGSINSSAVSEEDADERTSVVRSVVSGTLPRTSLVLVLTRGTERSGREIVLLLASTLYTEDEGSRSCLRSTTPALTLNAPRVRRTRERAKQTLGITTNL